MGNGKYQVPFVVGKTREEAEAILRKFYFVIGDESFEDNANPETARVYSQSPSADQGEFLNPGQPVNLIYRDPEKFDFDEYLESLQNKESNEIIE